MRIYNPQNQFGKDLVTYELVNTKLSAITGYGLEGAEPGDDLQTQINNIVAGGLKYKVLLKGTDSTPDTWLWLKALIDKESKSTEDITNIKNYLKTVILVDEKTGGEAGNVYTEYLVFNKGTEETPVYAYEKIGEIGGDVEKLTGRIKALEDNSIGDVKVTDSTGAITVTVADSTDPDQNPKKTATITVLPASTAQHGVVMLSEEVTGSATEEGKALAATEYSLLTVRTELKTDINNLVIGDTAAVGQVRVVPVTVTGTEHVSGTFTINPVSGAGTVKILTVEDQNGEEWSFQSVSGDDKKFKVWNDGATETDDTDWDVMDTSVRPTSFKVSYVITGLSAS